MVKEGSVSGITVTSNVHESEFPAVSSEVIVTSVVPEITVPGSGFCVSKVEPSQLSSALARPV